MKTIWIAIALFVAVLAGSVALYIYTTVLHSDLQDNLHRIHQAVEVEDWAEVCRETEQLQKIWARTDASWTPIMDHRQVDRLDESLTRVMKLAELRSRDELLIEVTLAMRMAKRIKDTEAPALRNIF